MRPDEIEVERHRRPEHAIEPLFYRRWSPRAMSGERLDQATLLRLFEAARWAPSSYNNQPWRFIYAHRGTKDWDRLFGLLVEGNAQWAHAAAVLVVIASKKVFDYNGKPSVTHAFDTGAAWQNLALQASLLGLVAHGMQGFDYERARTELGVPDEYSVEAMVAIGHPGNIEDLPENRREQELPSDRKKLSEIVMEGRFRA